MFRTLLHYILYIFKTVVLWIQTVLISLTTISSSKHLLNMDITRQNFANSLAKIKESIEDATFLSIDCELTGLNTTSNINAFDTLEQYYGKMKANSREFLVIQYGLTTFRFDKKNGFKQSSYNFYIFRRPINKNIPDQRFLCQTSSIDFLISQGFDFNKLFKEGISYLNLDEEIKYKENLEEKLKRESSNSTNTNENKVAIPPNDQPFIDEVMDLIRKYLKTTVVEPFQLPKCNPFLRKLIYQTSAELFGDKIKIVTKQLENRDRILFLSRVKSPEELAVLAKQKEEEDLKVFNDCFGFTKVLRMIVDSGKLVVGHNLLLDLLHSIDKFLTPLPENYDEFKDCAHGLFTNILDTKLMSSSETFKDLINSSVLGQLYESVQKEPFIIPPVDIEDGCFGYTIDSKREHEAAFDAYITGMSFIAMWNYLGKQRNLSTEETFSNFDLLKPYLNKIYVMRLQDNQYINLSGKDPNPSRDHVFHLSFPSDWKNSDMQQLFSPFGNIFISWINDSSAFVSLHKRDEAALAYTSLADHDTCIVKTYSEYMESKEKPSQATRRKCDESSSQSIKKRKTSEESHRKEPQNKKKTNKKQTKIAKTFAESDNWE